MTDRQSFRCSSGFTLTELLIVISIMAILAAVTIPSFNGAIVSNRISKETNDLRADIEFARTQAQSNGLAVILCPSNNSATCANQTDWTKGWIVIAANLDCTVAAGATPLRIKPPLPPKLTASYIPSAAQPLLCFNRIGLATPNFFGTFTLDSDSGSSSKRCIAISQVGNVQVLKNGKTDDVSGVTCS